MDFAVWHDGMDAQQGRWVLAVEKDRVLLANNDGEMYWRPMKGCKVVKVANPDVPRAVIPVPPQGPQIVRPGVNGHLV